MFHKQSKLNALREKRVTPEVNLASVQESSKDEVCYKAEHHKRCKCPVYKI